MFKTNTFYTYQCDRGSLEAKFTKNHGVIINVYAIYSINAYCEKLKCIVAPRACINPDTGYAC